MYRPCGVWRKKTVLHGLLVTLILDPKYPPPVNGQIDGE